MTKWCFGWSLALLLSIHYYNTFLCVKAQGLNNVNRLIGSCLTDEWVHQVEQELGINATERDAKHRRKHPYLHRALPKAHPRYYINDPRTAATNVYAPDCTEPDGFVYGVNVQIDPNGTLIDTHQFNGSLIVQIDGWATHTMSTSVLQVLAGELLGYAIAENTASEYNSMTERMSSTGLGVCNPVHIDMEVWPVGIESLLDMYSNESYCAGKVGYTGRAGVYTTTKFVRDGLGQTGGSGHKYNSAFSADFWKDYKYNDDLIHALAVSNVWNNTKFFPPANPNACADGVMGCHGNCSKTHACTLWEQQGKECMVVVMGWYGQEGGYIQAMFSNNEIPTYFCFVGRNQYSNYAVDAEANDRPVIFYYYEPDDFLYRHKGEFKRVTFPYPTPEHVALATGTFGENGFGQPTDNHVDVDFSEQYLSIYAASLLLEYPPIAKLLSRFTISPTHLDSMMIAFTAYDQDAADFDYNQGCFDVACEWTKSHYTIWRDWLEPLPLCSFHDVQIVCKNSGQSPTGVNITTVGFEWTSPHPDDKSLPYTCDGGLSALPEPMVSHLACEELTKQSINWFLIKPKCDQSFFYWTISECDSKAKRIVHYEWYIPQAANASLSMECDGLLPLDDRIECDYFVTHSSAYVTLSVLAGVIMFLFVVLMALVYYFRDAPILCYGGYEQLELMLVGGVLVGIFVFVQGGKPTEVLCALRPTLIVVGFTCVVGPLAMKSYGTRHLAMLKAANREKHVGWVRRRCLHGTAGLLLVDALLLLGWFATDFPSPKLVDTTYTNLAIAATIPDLQCKSDGILFAEVLVLWKIVVVVVSLLLAAMNRRVKFDYGESFWLGASSASIFVGGLLIIVLVAGTPLSRSSVYFFEDSLALLMAALVAGLMIVTKLVHLSVEEISMETVNTVNSENTSGPRNNQVHPQNLPHITQIRHATVVASTGHGPAGKRGA